MTAQQLFSISLRNISGIFLLLALLGLNSTYAADAKVNNVRAPFFNRLLNQSWNVLEVSVENPTPKPLNSTIIVRVKYNEGVYMRKIWLPAKSRGRFQLPIYCNIPTDKLKGKFHTKTSPSRTLTYADGSKRKIYTLRGVMDCSAALLRKGNSNEYGKYNTNLSFSNAQTKPVIILNEYTERSITSGSSIGWDKLPRILGDGGGYSLSYQTDNDRSILGDYCLPDNNGQLSVFTTYMRSKDLSYYPQQMDKTGSFWVGTLHNEINPAIKYALDQWIKSGGQLNICPQPGDTDYLSRPFWAANSAATVAGFANETARPLTELSKKYGGKISTKSDATMMYSLLLPQTPPATEQSITLQATTKNEFGSLSMIAIGNEQSRYWAKANEFYKPLLLGKPKLLAGVESNFFATGWQEIQNMTGWSIPGKSTITIIMLSYLIIGSGVILIMRKKGNTEYGWLGLMVIGIIFFGIYIAISSISRSSSKSNAAQTSVTILTTDTPTTASNYGFLGIYPPKNISGNLVCNLHNALLFSAPISTDDVTAIPKVFLWNQTSSLPSINLSTGNFWAIGIQSYSDMGNGISVSCSFDKKGITGSAFNNTPYDLDNCFVRLNRACYYVGNLQRGQARDFSNADRIWQWDIASRFSSNKKAKNQILIKALFPQNLRYTYNSAPAFCGFINASATPFTLNGEVTADKTIRLVATAPQFKQNDTNEFLIPQGTCGIQINNNILASKIYNNKSAATLSSTPNPSISSLKQPIRRKSKRDNKPAAAVNWPHFQSGNGSIQANIDFTIPEYFGHPQLLEAKLIVKGRIKGMKLQISAILPKGKNSSRTLKIFDNTEINESITIPAKYISGNQLPKFKIYISPTGSAKGLWEIDTFDIEIKARSGSGNK